MDVARLSTASQPTSPSDWSPGSPSRSPAWRWLRARWLVQTGEEPRPEIDDPWVLRGRDFLAARIRAEAKPASRRSADRLDPAIVGTVALVNDSQSFRRSWLEANL